MSVRTILQAYLPIVAQAFDDDHLNCTFQSMVTGIIVLADQGRRADAEAEFRQVLDAELRVLGPDHPHDQVR
jgi:Tetratricopeptide repeat